MSCDVFVARYGLNEIALSFRTRLTQHLYKVDADLIAETYPKAEAMLFQEYLSGFTYYKLSNLDNRIGNPDQLLTQDVDKFATRLDPYCLFPSPLPFLFSCLSPLPICRLPTHLRPSLADLYSNVSKPILDM